MTQITLATLAEATPQQVFDQAVLGVLRQGMRFWSGDSSIFRDDHGNASPAGHLMSATECAALESVWGMDESWLDLVDMGGVPCAHRALIQWLEAEHDEEGEASMDRQTTGGAVLDAGSETDAYFIKAFRAAAAIIAREHGLSFNAVPELSLVVETETPDGFRNVWTQTDDAEMPLTFASIDDALDHIAQTERCELAAGVEPRRVRIAARLATVQVVEEEVEAPRP